MMGEYSLSFITGVIAAFGSLFLVWGQYVDTEIEKRTKTKKWLMYGGIFMTILSLISAYSQWSEKNKEESLKIKSDKEQKIEKRKSDSLQGEIYKLVLINKEDSKKSDEKIIALQSDLYARATGGDNYPIVQIQTSQQFVEEKSKLKYYQISFIMRNKGNYPLQNVKWTISDMHSKEMFKYGVKITNDPFWEGREKVTSNDIEDFNFTSKGDIGPFSNHEFYNFHKGTVCPELSPFGRKFLYHLKINWNGGYFYYLIELTEESDKLKLDNVGLVFGYINGKKIKEVGNFSKLTQKELRRFILFNRDENTF